MYYKRMLSCHPTLKRFLTVTSATCLFVVASTQNCVALEAQKLQISRLGDTELSCGELSEEASLMQEIVNTTQSIKDQKDFEKTGVTAAGAIGSFLVGSVTGGIGIAAAGYLLKDNLDDHAESANGIQDIAKQRRMLMIGIYHAKGCSGPIETIAIDKTPTPDLVTRLTDIAPASGGRRYTRPANHFNE